MWFTLRNTHTHTHINMLMYIFIYFILIRRIILVPGNATKMPELQLLRAIIYIVIMELDIFYKG